MFMNKQRIVGLYPRTVAGPAVRVLGLALARGFLGGKVRGVLGEGLADRHPA